MHKLSLTNGIRSFQNHPNSLHNRQMHIFVAKLHIQLPCGRDKVLFFVDIVKIHSGYRDWSSQTVKRKIKYVFNVVVETKT